MSVSNVLANYREFGLAKTISFYKGAALNKLIFFRQFQAMIVTMTTLDSQYLDPSDGYQYRFLTERELVAHSKVEENELGPAFLQQALGKGDRCFAVLDGGEMASDGWYSTQPTEMGSGLLWCFDPSRVYMYKGFTKPAYRGKRLHAFGMAGALKASVEEGARGLVSNVETNNFRSLKSVYRMGYRNIGKITVTRPAGVCRIRAEKECFPYGVTVREVQAPSPPSVGLTESERAREPTSEVA